MEEIFGKRYTLAWAADDDVRRLEMKFYKRRDALRFPATELI